VQEHHEAAFLRLEDSIRKTLDRAHNFHVDLSDDQNKVIDDIDKRLDTVESVLDQQRGARNLVYALIGTNTMAAVIGAIAIATALFG
jgi:hypothetical protein